MFPRAKLQRFNDVTSDVPPPGSYDPKFDSKVKGLTMDKMTERFVESKSVVNDSGVQRSASLNALPVFRTPLMPKRTVKKSVSTVKSKQDSSVVDKVRRNIDSDFSSSEDLTLLPDKNCDLTNLQEQLNQTFLKLEGSESKCKQLEMELAQSKEVTEMLEREKTDLLKEVDRLIEETANQNVKLLNITESCDKAEASLAERKAAVFELQQSKTELLLNIEILNGKVDQNRNEIEQSVRCCLDLEGSLAEARAQNENLLQTRVSLTNDIADLQERLNEASMQIQVREEHCETLEHAKQDLLIQVDEKLQAIDELTVKIEQSEKRSVQLESLLNESKSLVTSLEEKNTILELEHKQLEDALSAVTCKLEICESKCKALELEIEECKENFVEVENAKINLMVLVEQLKSELDSLQKALSSAEKSLEEKNELCQEEEEEKAKLHQQIKELGLLTAELNQKLQQRQQVILGLQSDLSNTSCALEEQRVEAERQATEYYAEIERICDKHNEEILLVHNDLAKSVADCEARVAQAQAEHENEAANLRDLAYKLEQQVLDERKTCKTVQKEFDEEREDHQLQLEALTNDAKKSSFLKANLECALAETKAELQSIKSSYSDLDRQMAEEIKMHKQEMASVQSKLMTCQKALVEEEQKARDTVEKLVKDSQRRISEIEISTRQALEEAEIKLEAAEAAYTQTLQQVRDDTQALVQATRTDALKEMELIKAEAEQKVCAAKEEVTTLSSKLEDINEKLQEINAVKDDLKSSNLDKDTLIVELKDRMNIMETELAQSRKHLADVENELEAVKNELEFMKKIRRNLEIIGHETLAIVNAVSKRLLDSDEEVVRLSQVNCALETTLNEQKENLTAMEEDNIRDIQDMKANLLEKVELFKQKCIDENSRLQGEIEILQESVQMYANQLVEANNQLEILSKDKEEQAVLIANLQQTTDELQATQDFLANQVEDYLSVKKSHQQLQKELGLCKDMLEKARADAADGEMEIQHREKQINDFTNQLDDLNDKVTELQGVILELETAAVESEQEVEQLERKLEQQKESALKNDWQIRELTNENVELRSQVADLKRDMEHQILSANQQVEELSSAKVDLQSQLDSLNTVLECHKMNVFKARERIETLVNVVARKESELEERAAEMSQMKDELLSKTNQLSELSVIISDKDQALLTLHQEADDLKCRFQVNNELITNMKNDIDFEVAFRKECELKITEMLQDKLGNEVLIEDLKEKVVELESSIIDKNVLISSLEEKIQESSSRFSMLNAEAEDSLKQISAAEERIDALEALRVEKDNEIAVLNSEVSQSKVDIEVQKSQITELANEVQNQTDLAKYLMTRVDENRKEVAKLEEEKMALQSEVSSLKMQIEMIQWESEESLQKAKKEVASQREEILNLTEHVERIKLDVEKEKRIGHDHNEALTEEISALKISLGAKTQEVGTIRGRVQQLEAELEQTTRRKETYKAAVVELQQAIKHSRSKMSSLEEEGKAACQKLEKEREQHFKELAALQEAAANGNSWEQRYLELEALVGPFREQLEAFESERQALALKKEAAEGEVKELAQRYAQVLGHQNHKQKIHHVIKLKEQILNLKKENERLESQARAQKRTIDKLKDDLARSTGQTRFNPALAFKSHDDSLQTRLSLASKSLLDNSGISKSFRIPSQHSTARKDKENISAFDTSTPVSTRTAAKVKDEILSPARNSPARNSPAASPATPLKEVQNQQ